ncbi:MAG: hypothetical protein WDO69_25105 [Pseudomonadota bacterium]
MDIETLRRNYVGPNDTIKAKNHLLATRGEGFKNLQPVEQIRLAGEFARSLNPGVVRAGGPGDGSNSQPDAAKLALSTLRQALADVKVALEVAWNLAPGEALTLVQESLPGFTYEHGVPNGPAPSDGESVDLRTYYGRNAVERAVAYLAEKQPGFAQRPRGEQLFKAGQFIRTKRVTL